MSNNPHILVKERSRDIGNFMVGRLLPFREKRQVGPFTFIDHMGPAPLGPDKYVDVDQHPHIGLSTLTYLLEGCIEHKDSTGAQQMLRAGDVGFMTAGKGVSHTERTPIASRTGDTFTMHGYQIWVALPKKHEADEPTFQYLSGETLPSWTDENLHFTLVAGKGYHQESPLKVFSDLFMVDIRCTGTQTLKINGQLEGEIAIVVTTGKVLVDDETIENGQMLISKTKDTCEIQVFEDTRLLLFGGEPLPEERYLYWNFVSSNKETLEQAKRDWVDKKFPQVPGDDTYIPLPGK